MSEIDDTVQKIYATTDALVWATEFCRIANNLGIHNLDKDWVAGWFANAIEIGREAGRKGTMKQFMVDDGV